MSFVARQNLLKILLYYWILFPLFGLKPSFVTYKIRLEDYMRITKHTMDKEK